MTCLLAALSASQAQTTFYWPGQPEDNTYA